MGLMTSTTTPHTYTFFPLWVSCLVNGTHPMGIKVTSIQDFYHSTHFADNRKMYQKSWTTFLHLVIFGVLHWCLQRQVDALVGVDECKMTKMVHVLKAEGCLPKRIPSFICHGRCSSYIQVSGSRMWQMERSCMCCQESGEREATVSLFCPTEKRKFRKVTTKAPLECMCRPCTGIEEYSVIPQEIAGFAEEGPLTTSAHFRRSSVL